MRDRAVKRAHILYINLIIFAWQKWRKIPEGAKLGSQSASKGAWKAHPAQLSWPGLPPTQHPSAMLLNKSIQGIGKTPNGPLFRTQHLCGVVSCFVVSFPWEPMLNVIEEHIPTSGLEVAVRVPAAKEMHGSPF